MVEDERGLTKYSMKSEKSDFLYQIAIVFNTTPTNTYTHYSFVLYGLDGDKVAAVIVSDDDWVNTLLRRKDL